MEGNGDRINEIADRTARIEGKLDQYLADQGRRCATHDQHIRDANARLSLVESGIESARREGVALVASVKKDTQLKLDEIEASAGEIKDRFGETITRAYLTKALTLTLAVVSVLGPIIYGLIRHLVEGQAP